MPKATIAEQLLTAGVDETATALKEVAGDVIEDLDRVVLDPRRGAHRHIVYALSGLIQKTLMSNRSRPRRSRALGAVDAAASLADDGVTDFTTGSLVPRRTLEWPALYAREQAATAPP